MRSWSLASHSRRQLFTIRKHYGSATGTVTGDTGDGARWHSWNSLAVHHAQQHGREGEGKGSDAHVGEDSYVQ